ncbi:MAG TPA: SH3 domain-containing protein [Thermomicrobiales bacterium]|nr:SH3 domain-containing protein [Thermomicrobiales bacterium]
MRRALTSLVLVVFLLSIVTPVTPRTGRAQGDRFSAGQQVFVTEDDVSIRVEPSPESPVVDTVDSGHPLRIVDGEPVESNGFEWWNVSDDAFGIEGWIASQFISADASAIASDIPTQAPASPTPSIASSTTETTLEARDLIFEPTTLYLAESDEPTVIHLSNKGALVHRFRIDELGIDVEAEPGETVDIEIPAGTAAGLYSFYCSVPGHREAGMAGTLVIVPDLAAAEASPHAAVDPPGCDGFHEYVTRLEAAIDRAASANPESEALFAGSPSSSEHAPTLMIAELTPEQMILVGTFFADAAHEMSLVEPPEFARSWSQLQIQLAETYAAFLEYAATNGLRAANLLFGTTLDGITEITRNVLLEGGPCPAFLAWAISQLDRGI